jgi:Flp pilus assembly protein TadD
MCRKPAFAATALVALMAATSVQAFPFGRSAKPAAATTPASQTATPDKALAPAPAEKASPAARAAAERMDPLARAAFWAREVNADPTDAEAGVRLAAALRALGRHQEASEAVQRVLVLQPDNIDALLESARVFVAQEQGFYAVAPVRRVLALRPADWRAATLLGVALDQAQRDDEAAAAHRQALVLAPANPTVLSNAAMYFASHGDLPQAENLLRRAAADPAAPVQARQNLALVLGLQGKMAEAEKLVRQDLPPEQANNNLAYLRAASGEAPGRNWNSLRSTQ